MLEKLTKRLLTGGYGKETPAALVYKATWPEEETYLCTVETLADVAKRHGITKTALVLVGDALAHRQYQKSRLYAADFSTAFREAAVTCREEKKDIRMSGIRLSVISFTKAGIQLSRRVKAALQEKLEVALHTKCKAFGEDGKDAGVSLVTASIGEWAGRRMQERNALLFIGACGIAVRAIAPYLTDKLQDAPVLVMDEKGHYVVPILAGHMGGANELAKMLAQGTGAQVVVTTATDLNQKFAVDIFAKENGFSISPKDGIAKISAKILAGEAVTVSVETGHESGFFERNGLREVPYPPTGYTDMVVTGENRAFDASVTLRPKEYILGFGCKKGKSADEIARFVEEKMEEYQIEPAQIFALASISQKKEEEGIREWCRGEGVRFLTYTAEELREIAGDFTQSSFVMDKVGVDNVCERAALKASGTGGKLIVKKYAGQGMTLAVAKREWKFTAWESG